MSVDPARLRVVEERAVPVERERTAGAALQRWRTKRGLSLDQLAVQTKIPRVQLEQLEADRFDELPAPVFARGFLRCCARALRIDEDELLEPLEVRDRDLTRAQVQRSGAGAGKTAAVGAAGGRGRWVTWFVVVGFGIALLSALIAVNSRWIRLLLS